MDQRDPEVAVVDYDEIDYSEELFALHNGKRYTGRAIERDETGSPVIESEFRGGIQHGIEREYYPNGNIKSEKTYDVGKPEGIGRTWHENGKLRTEAIYKHGHPVSVSEWSEDGQPL
jgi:antitoxin component YwqK of YwqJK toxin-antitoxin module